MKSDVVRKLGSHRDDALRRASVAYLFVVVVLRTSGKRTLAKPSNAFDFVVTITLGSLLANVAVARSLPLIEGLVALSALVVLQFVVAKTSSRWPFVRRAVTSSPTAVLVAGRLEPEAMRASRITRDEVAAAIRKEGYGSLEEIEVVVFETDGSFSVIARRGTASALDDVVGAA